MWSFPLAMLWTEVEIARDHDLNRMATEAILIRSAIVDVVAGGNHLQQTLEDMR